MGFEDGYDVYEYSRRGRLADLKQCLAEGSKPDAYLAYDGSTALIMASRGGHDGCVRVLLDAKADPGVRTDDGSTLLHHAVSGGTARAVQALVSAGVGVDEPNEDGVTPLILAAHYGLGDVVSCLIDGGADISRQAGGWGNALDSATGDAVAVLEGKGAKRSAVTGRFEDQPEAKGAERFSYGCFEAGENPNSTPTKAPEAPVVSRRPVVGDSVRLSWPKSGVLQEGQVGTVIDDDGTDSLPLKVEVEKGGAYDYYNVSDVVICEPPIDLGPDSDRATVEGTQRGTAKRLKNGVTASMLGSSGLSISPVGFGCHRLDGSTSGHKQALSLALSLGCNLIDLAPNYCDGSSETAAGDVLKEMFDAKKLRRDEIVVITKAGNVLGQQMQFAGGVDGMSEINENLWHCISPEWIEQELTRSLERLQLSCVDCLLLHCPECEMKAPGVDMAEVYKRLAKAFAHLEKEVAKGRIAMYGVSAAFHPLRPTDAEHLDLDTVMAQLPKEHHFRVIQFPLNFAEAQIIWIGHTPRDADGAALDRDRAMSAPPLLEAAKAHSLAVLINRPLDGIYKESHGVLRFSSLDCDVRSFSELQLDNCDALEEKLTRVCKLDGRPYNAGEGASGELAAKTVKVLTSLENVDCVLLGMRRPEYVVSTLPLALGTPRVPPEDALAGVKAMHNTVSMWFATAIHEADHGTAKDWRLPTGPMGGAMATPEAIGA
eukprot:gnl/TRDRNA2_/TRDRNA2_75519_c0_seq1.p1 gnl/TRDRNA2_/TRDRNA2_75519_c0~~gnl/TRDRNA2_/TRDRNA2_75519_c0_seq1.p1  ORF type:complete len:744 (+),score=134.57 gnl/TRDRNA2_/TRDRNA2_75519_c0_seq1:95-2233(+)